MRQLQSSCVRLSVLGIAFAVSTLAIPQLKVTQDHFYDLRETTAPPAIKTLLTSQRKLILSQKLHFTVGYTSALQIGVSKITGGQRITDPTVVPKWNSISAQLKALDDKALNAALLKNPALRQQIPILRLAPQTNWPKLDWRTYSMVSPVKDQGPCGTCWAFASIGALEASSRLINNQPVDASEQYVITNDFADWYVPGNWDGGGWGYKAITFLVNQGTVAETTDPYSQNAGTRNPSEFKPYGGTYWGFCHSTNGQATVAEVKSALCAHGPVVTWIDAGGSFGAYTSGVYDDTSPDSTDGHFVVIVGWDDSTQAWLIKNSWGTSWGDTCGYGTERGYAWVHYGVHGVGTDSCWIHDHSIKYMIDSAAWEKILNIKNVRKFK